MPDNMKDKLIVPVEIPAWAVITFLISGAFGYGILYNQLNELVKDKERVNTMFVNQIRNIEAVNRHEQMIQNLDHRVTNLERGKKWQP